VKIVVDDLASSRVATFLGEHLRQLHSITPLANAHALDLDELRRPEITFWVALDDDNGGGGDLLGCAALKELDPHHGEVKSMRTDPARTRGGIASRLLDHLIAEARGRGYTRVSLETGTDGFFAPARRLYEKFGFAYCEPFAGYQPSPHNTFMTRPV
jgi:putative acetyltransferase